MLLWWPILWLFILHYCIEGTVNELEVVYCTFELTFLSSSDLISGHWIDLFGIRKENNCFLNPNNNNNIDMLHFKRDLCTRGCIESGIALGYRIVISAIWIVFIGQFLKTLSLTEEWSVNSLLSLCCSK